jgi:hypothetical protein
MLGPFMPVVPSKPSSTFTAAFRLAEAWGSTASQAFTTLLGQFILSVLMWTMFVLQMIFRSTCSIPGTTPSSLSSQRLAMTL